MATHSPTPIALGSALKTPPVDAVGQLIDALPIGVAVALAPSGELIYANAPYVELLGIPENPRDAATEPLTQPTSRGTYALQDREGGALPEECTPFQRALRERRVIEVDDIAIVRPDGSRVYVRAFGRPLFDAQGTVSHVLLALTDISAEVSAELESELTRERLMIALQHTPIALFTADETGVVTVSEGAALASLGFRPGELVGSNLFDVYAHVPEILENLKRAYRGESFTVTNKLGETVLESWLAPLRSGAPGGGGGGIIGVSIDITERLRLQKQVTHADRMLVLGRVAASVAHEINNPLAFTIEALRLASELAQRMPGDGAPSELLDVPKLRSELALLRQVLVDAAEGADRVRLITRDLKVFARPDDDERKPISLDAALRTAARFVARRTDERARVQLDLDSHASVLTSESRLVQIFTNLLLNAADALSAEPVTQNLIRVSTRREGDCAIAEIADNGPGIAEALYAQVFEPFFTSKAAGEGTGLGLYVTRTLVEGLQGRIEVGHAPEGGALFRVRLPCSAEPVESEARPSSLPPPSRRPRVLVIDDEAMITRVFRASLEAECDVEIAHSGRRALERLIAGERYDCIFCDLMMGDLNGAALYRALQAQAPGREAELIFMTGGVYDQSVAELLDHVPNRCIDKPFDIRAEVMAVVGERERAERRALR